MMKTYRLIVWLCVCVLGGAVAPVAQTQDVLRPIARDGYLPAARWDDQPRGALWTRVAMSAFARHASDITEVVPGDIAQWCPAYATNGPQQRRAFWVGLMSTVAFYESTHRPRAVGGDDQWFGLMQIYPPTADSFGCRAVTGAGLQAAPNNLSCAARIMGETVARDGAVARAEGRWRGVAADWAPFRDETKRANMQAWVQDQSYCRGG